MIFGCIREIVSTLIVIVTFCSICYRSILFLNSSCLMDFEVHYNSSNLPADEVLTHN